MEANAGGVQFRAVEPADGAALVALFERAASQCYCRYWHFPGDKNGWLDRLAHHPGESRRELLAELAEPVLSPHGIVAVEAERVLGWMKLTRAARVQKLYAQRPYRGLPCLGGDRADTLTIGCFLVDPARRRQGLARGLLQAGIELGARTGARAIEAFPRQGEGLGDAELWLGPDRIYQELGFRTLHTIGPYPVLRKDL